MPDRLARDRLVCSPRPHISRGLKAPAISANDPGAKSEQGPPGQHGGASTDAVPSVQTNRPVHDVPGRVVLAPDVTVEVGHPGAFDVHQRLFRTCCTPGLGEDDCRQSTTTSMTGLSS